ncbi:MAG TPA: ABC transporter permease [Polyangiaceae bacterium]|nr:ABC transporter permease [Polyangiaceae bacterium]
MDLISYWESVWLRLCRNRLAMFGLWCIAGLCLLAVGAPLLSLNQPLYWNAGQGAQFPWLWSLFNRLLFENSVDLFFNTILVALPLWTLGYLLWAKKRRLLSRKLLPKYLMMALGFHVALLCALGPSRFIFVDNPLYVTRPVLNYRVEEQRLHGAGQAVSSVFPMREWSYRETDPAQSVQGPSAEHWLGTDTEGRDVFARMLYGTRISLTIGVVAVLLYVGIGVVLGALAGYFGGWVDNVISRAIEVMICFPSFFLILTLAALIEERSIFHVMIIIGVTSWTGVARLIRAEFLKQKNLDYAQAAVALGLSQTRIIFRHLLPNSIAPVLVTATFGIASAILIESSLSFLGIGDVTAASWGQTLNAGRLEQKLWLVLAPGFAIFFVVSVFNLVGEGLRDALDPKLKS